MSQESEQRKSPKPEEANHPPKTPVSDMSAASFWDPSQIQEVIRHAGATGRSPEEFFNKKWKDKLIHKKQEGEGSSEADAKPSGE